MTRILYLIIACGLLATGLIACSQGGPQPNTGLQPVPLTAQAPTAPTVAPAPGGPAVAATGASAAAATGPTATLSKYAAIVNDEPIPMEEYQREVALARAFFISQGSADPNTPEGKQYLSDVAQQVLEDQLIAQALIRQAAAREGITVSDEQVQKAIKDMEDQAGGKDAVDTFLAGQNMTRDDLVKQQRDRLITEALQAKVITPLGATADQVHVRDILVTTKDQADKALARIKAGEDFAKVANEVSKDATSDTKGGDLGWLVKGLRPELDAVAFSLPPKGISDVFQSPDGWHVLQVVERDQNHPLTDDQKEALREQAFQDWLRAERARAKVEIFVK